MISTKTMMGLVVCAALSTPCNRANAETLFENPLNSINGDCLFQCWPSFGRHYEVFGADNFVLSHASLLDGFTFDGIGNVANPVSTDWRLYDFGTNFSTSTPDFQLGSLLTSGTTIATDDGNNPGGGYTEFKAALPDLTLNPGQYWLALSTRVQGWDGDYDGTALYWGLGFGDGVDAWNVFPSNGSGWTDPYAFPTGGWSFSILGHAAVPEPSSWAMMFVGVVALGSSLRRRRSMRASVA